MILSIEKKQDVEYAKALMETPGVCIPSMLIFGEPGAGKTSFAKYLASKLDAEIIFAPCYDGIGVEQMVYNWDLGTLVDAMTDEKTSGRQALKDGYLLQALKLSQTKKTILILDEIDKAKPSVDTFLLSYMQECMLNDPLTGRVEGKRENLFIVFTSNKRRELEDALDRRISMIREFHFPERSELIEQVKMMINVDFNETKFHFVIDLALEYRKLNVTKKPSQNQIADLINELDFIEKRSKANKATARVLKYRAMFWKFSQEPDDHKVFDSFLKKKFSGKSKDTGLRYLNYVGSMI